MKLDAILLISANVVLVGNVAGASQLRARRKDRDLSGGIYCEPTNPKFPCCNNGPSECSSEYNCCDAFRNTCVDTTKLRDFQLRNLRCKETISKASPIDAPTSATEETPAPTEMPTESPTGSPIDAPTSATEETQIPTEAPTDSPTGSPTSIDTPTSASPATAAPVGLPVNTADTADTAYTCSEQSNPCNADNAGKMFAHTDPTKFVHCAGAETCWVKTCAPGTVWDSSLPPAGGCNHPN
mmetsp:Transcript_30126/g.65211  ORF Transcript_30126/g.65211 Transcript_30126/m.65211 type:complete len:240 (-) Transcript_30126:235-954(-)